TDELDRERDARRHRHERGQPDGRVARAQIGRIIGAPKSSALGVEEQRGELEVEVGPQTEDEADRGGDGKRDHEAGSGHAVDPTRVYPRRRASSNCGGLGRTPCFSRSWSRRELSFLRNDRLIGYRCCGGGGSSRQAWISP